MEYEYLTGLKKHASWKLLAADSSSLIISFFHRVFIKGNQRTVPVDEMESRLEDYLFYLRRILGDNAFPRQARVYLDEWAGPDTGFLRKFYPARGEQAEYDLTPASEKVLEWVSSFAPRQFVGTESRLLTIFRLLREIVSQAMVDPDQEIRRLEKEKADIEQQIQALKAGRFPDRDSTRIRERFLELGDTARRLLFDFRQVEENFRELDRKTREKITVSDRPKGQLLDEIFGDQDAISGSDQGKSFQAFWQYIMNPVSQDELDMLLSQVLDLPEILRIDDDAGLSRMRFLLIDAGERVNITRARLVEQLRKFLDDQAWLENKRIMELIRQIEKKAVAVRQNPPTERGFSRLDHVRPEIVLPMERGLFMPPEKIRVDDQVSQGKADFDADVLYSQQVVDRKKLARQVQVALRGRSQASLREVCEKFPVKQGLTELLTYLQIACESEHAMVENSKTTTIEYEDISGRQLKAVMPEVIFVS